MKCLALSILSAFVAASAPAAGQQPPREPIRLANQPTLSPDGSTLAFAWGGDLWSVPTAGGKAKPLTRSAAVDREPEFSPDGKTIAFTSDRQGTFHPYVMPADGGVPRQVGFHSAGYAVEGWSSDGRSLLVSASRDHHWRDADRFFLIPTEERSAEIPLFDSAGKSPAISPDGKTVLFTREGTQWWRKGYKGSQDSQIWSYDRESKAFQQVLAPPGGALFPLWGPEGKTMYYVGVQKGAFNLFERDLATNADRALTDFTDDSVVYPCISRDGSTIVFRHLFDFYRVQPGSKTPAEKIEIYREADDSRDPIERRVATTASQVAFSKDGLEIAFIAGGDLWVMDTELREPKQVTKTAEEERDPVFSPKGDAILFVSDQKGQADIWKAEKGDAGKDWWLNASFKLERLTEGPEVEADLKWSPDGGKVAFLRERGDLWIMNPDGKDAKRLFESFESPRFDWSPDGTWLVYAKSDDDFNSDVWIAPIDGSKPPFNVSRHPDNEGNPVWSPDGKVIAFTGRRIDTEVDVYFVYLREEDEDRTDRDRTLEKAIEKMKARQKGARSSMGRGGRPGGSATTRGEEAPVARAAGDDAPTPAAPAAEEPKKAAEVVIDFDRLHERIHRVSIPNSTENGLFWSPDSKKLAFTGTVESRPGVYTIEFPSELRPKLLSGSPGSQARWLESNNQIVWLSGGIPASLNPNAGGGSAAPAPPTAPVAGRGGRFGGSSDEGSGNRGETQYRFRAPQEISWPDRYRAGFDLAWRTMRDRFYDGNLGNRNWDAIRRKYSDMAAESPDRESFATVVNLMLGELNGSHLGFSASREREPEPGGPDPTPTPGPRFGGGDARWSISTPHFGLRFEPEGKGPGLKIRDVIPGTPADHKGTKILAGETLMAVDGTPVDPALDLTRVLNGPADRDVRLTIRNAEGKDREVVLRPISYTAARALLYDKWIADNRKMVDQLSGGKLGYLHIRGMNMPSFYQFEQDLYAAGSGKDGLIVDVRENGGGSTADHLLTALTQPAHAITVPRGGGPGYPQDRRIYATWTKPIVVLCNQNSFSNAEIFSHAIKTLKRGQLVGAPTAGGVVSTGSTGIMDLGSLRLPTRGWFLPDTGEDMELNGAVPHHIVWPDPADFAKGADPQIAKGVEVLAADVKAEAAKPRPKLRKASEREENRRPSTVAGGGE
ncbi:S41 family peptidase [Tundrisphaera sp. TA3]|uniref:S41 family peptidase n=1 Tax=Tundrisphaera sp. TA3 TaxID=3435775 RepID=UPI003EB7757E